MWSLQACGVPVVLARASSLPEVGADAAMYFEPGDHVGLAGILGTVAGDDTILIVVASDVGGPTIAARLSDLAGL